MTGNSETAIAYVATGKEVDGNPSHRYISLLREGARSHGLPEHGLEFLDTVMHAEQGRARCECCIIGAGPAMLTACQLALTEPWMI